MDARKTLAELRSEWENCTRCELGIHRVNNNGSFVFGEGAKRGIMFIGEGPGVEEERQGIPFIGKSGSLLRSILTKLSVTDAYITNTVACRSCEPVLDPNTGLPRLMKRRYGPSLPMFKDLPPTPPQWKACQARLYEEIYLVDPVIIVSLGGTAGESLIGKSITITRDRGREVHIEVPGAGYRASLTDKKQQWIRKVHGEVVMPVNPAMVRYTLIPTLHPAYVLKKIADMGHNSPFRQLVEDIRKAVKIYEMYMQEVHQRVPTGDSDASYESVANEYFSTEEKEQ
jgi:uracil-DNA glycosylase